MDIADRDETLLVPTNRSFPNVDPEGWKEIPFLAWFGTQLDALILEEARRHPCFLVWLDELVNHAIERAGKQLRNEQDDKPFEPPGGEILK